jgi:hypothetical protein
MSKQALVSKPDKSVITNGLSDADSLDLKPAATSRFKASNANGVVRLVMTRAGCGIPLLNGIPVSMIPAWSSCSPQALSSDSDAAPRANVPCSQYSAGVTFDTREAADDLPNRKQPLAVDTSAPSRIAQMRTPGANRTYLSPTYSLVLAAVWTLPASRNVFSAFMNIGPHGSH